SLAASRVNFSEVAVSLALTSAMSGLMVKPFASVLRISFTSCLKSLPRLTLMVISFVWPCLMSVVPEGGLILKVLSLLPVAVREPGAPGPPGALLLLSQPNDTATAAHRKAVASCFISGLPNNRLTCPCSEARVGRRFVQARPLGKGHAS